jgi:hypothetical protein
MALIPGLISSTSRRSTGKWRVNKVVADRHELASTLASPVAVVGPEKPSLPGEFLGQSHLEALQLLLAEESPLLPTMSRTGDDHRIASQSLNPDALRTSYEQP